MKDTDIGQMATPYGLAKRKIGKLATKYETGGKVQRVMHEWKSGALHSGSKKGPVVRDRKQAIAIALSEQRKSLGKKYGVGGGVGFSGQPVAAPRSTGGFWSRLQNEIQALNANSLKPQSPSLGGSGPSTAVQQPPLNPSPLAPSPAGRRRGGRP